MKYDFKKIEKHWQEAWRTERAYEPDLDKAKRPFYNLMMFPYPSAEGLHVGNMYAFVGSDIYGRFKRMEGHDVFEPIGLDGFGIHSENYALKIGAHPMEQAKVSEERFYKQLEAIGNGFAWNERVETYDPEYYRWTQWLFVEMFKRGLAYRKKQEVNWCPSCKTVLADEQVIKGAGVKGQGSSKKEEILNVCERCGTEVIKKELEQWFFKITDYAERLLKNLEHLDWSEKIKIAQKAWIGRSDGAEIRFRCQVSGVKKDNAEVRVFTTRPDTLFGATYLVVAPEHEIISNLKSQISPPKVDPPRAENLKDVEKYIKEAAAKSQEERIAEGREKSGVELMGIKAINPANKEEIPIWVADYVLGGYGTGAIMAVPAHDERDFEFARKFKLPVKMVVCPHYPAKTCPVMDTAYTGEGHLVDSGRFDGMESSKAKWEIMKFVGGERKIQYRLRDWLISRQRYWGPPIPLIFCEDCKKSAEGSGVKGQGSDFSNGELENPGWVPVPEKDLPVRLPFIKNFRPTGTGKSPLASVEEFYEVKCPRCGGAARRETDVSDTFLDSAWYYLAYLTLGGHGSRVKGQENKNQKFILDEQIIKQWLPVDMYIGGAEHAVLHLLYVRFVAMAMHDMGIVKFSAKGGSPPSPGFGRAGASGGDEPFKKFRAHGLLIKDGAKMSKSKGNVINPDEYIKNFGADALRMYLMFLAPFEQGGDFRDAGILGVERFLNRVWKLSEGVPPEARLAPWGGTGQGSGVTGQELKSTLHKTIKKITDDIEHLHYNTAISALMIFFRELESADLDRAAFEAFIKLLAPFAPHMAEEVWRNVLGHETSIHLEPWPEYDEKFTKEKTFTLVIQVNGKVRDSVEAPSGITEQEAEETALRRERIAGLVGSKKPKRIIYVPGRLVNLVL